MRHAHDGTVLQVNQEWPSVARCDNGEIGSDGHACDHDNRLRHAHDGTTYLQLEEEYRPVIKCIDPVHGNPISCDHNDITDFKKLDKDSNGFTPTKVVVGGPSAEGKDVSSPNADEE